MGVKWKGNPFQDQEVKATPPPTLDPRPKRRLGRGMKPALLSLVIALLMVGCGDGTVDQSDLEYRNGVAYLPNEETPFTGRAERFYENGQKRESSYKDGKAHGLMTVWYENGQKKAERIYKDGNQNGLETTWQKSGEKKWEINYKDGKRHGLWTWWQKNGQKQEEGNYTDGLPQGVWIMYKYDGTEWGRDTYKDGLKVFD